MVQLGRWWVLAAFVLLAAGCGGSGGSAPTGPAVKAPECPRHPTPGHGSSYAGSCRSPDGFWLLSFHEHSGSKDTLSLTKRGQNKSVQMNMSLGSPITWARPHLLLFDDDTLVTSLNPASRKVRALAQLADLAVSPNGSWFAGNGASLDPSAYVLSTDGRTCLVIPGHTFG